MKKVVPVIEFQDFLGSNTPSIDLLLILNFFPDSLEDSDFRDDYLINECSNQDLEENGFHEEGSSIRGFLSYGSGLIIHKAKCMLFEGTSNTLSRAISSGLLKSYHSIMVLNAEVVLHENYGSVQFWEIRRSMTLSHQLVSIANNFLKRLTYNEEEEIEEVITADGEAKTINNNKKNGLRFVGVHLRRGDFARYRVKNVPSIECAAEQIIAVLKSNQIKRLFVATDATRQEINSLLEYLKSNNDSDKTSIQVYFFAEISSLESHFSSKLLDGQKAIIDQWICAQASIFIGRYFTRHFKSTISKYISSVFDVNIIQLNILC